MQFECPPPSGRMRSEETGVAKQRRIVRVGSMAATMEAMLDIPEEETLDLSNQGLKKLTRPSPSQSKVSKLVLDNNDLTRLDCIDYYTALKSLSAARNGLLRMYNVARLYHLVCLNLANNGILTIEGLKDATQLRWLCLAGNNIKTIEHLNTNTLLEYIDLSENNVSFITDISYLVNLKTLILVGNKIGHLQACDKFLPQSLDTLSLAANNITDLNQVSFLVNLRDLRQLSIANNPCVAMTGNNVGFDYRPFLINWSMGLKVIDGFVVNEIESLKAEWLYSQGRGRQFRPGDHESLVAYLASTCPLGGESLETEEDRKLRLILSKAQHHQQQLKQQQADGSLHRSSSVSPFSRRRTSNSYNRSSLNRGRRRTYTPDRMSTSFHNELSSTGTGSEVPALMTQSLDLSMFNSSDSEDFRRKTPSQLVPQDEDSPLHSATEMVPVPDSLLSPEYRPIDIDIIPAGTSVQTPATPATPATPSHPLAKKGIAQPLVTRANVGPRQSRLPVRGVGGFTANSSGAPTASPLPGGCLDDSSTSQRTEAVSLGTPYEQPEHPSMTLESQEVMAPTYEENGVAPAVHQIVKKKLGDESSQSTPVPSARTAPTPKPTQKTDAKRPTSLDLSFNNSEAFTNGWSGIAVAFSGAERQKCAATSIQRLWRGYYTRNLDPRVAKVSRSIQDKRTLEHIRKLTHDLESTKSALEGERRLQLLQMQAISALWKKVVALQGGAESGATTGGSQGAAGNSAECIRKLTHSCLHLHTQVAELQQSMQEVTGVLGLTSRQGQIPRVASATQTELSAVHTPTGACAFPFQKVGLPANLNSESTSKPADGLVTERVAHRPSSLPLNTSHPPTHRLTPPQLNHFANTLVDGVLRTVSSTDQGSDGHSSDENNTKGGSTLDDGGPQSIKVL